MNISLSSANRQLARLREAWGDPLFVRTGSLMKATPAAARRRDCAERIVRDIEALTLEEDVQPALLKQTVRIATYDNAFAVGARRRLRRASDEASGRAVSSRAGRRAHVRESSGRPARHGLFCTAGRAARHPLDAAFSQRPTHA